MEVTAFTDCNEEERNAHHRMKAHGSSFRSSRKLNKPRLFEATLPKNIDSELWDIYKERVNRSYEGDEDRLRREIFDKRLSALDEHRRRGDLGLVKYGRAVDS